MPNLIGGIVLGYIWQLIFNGILAKYSTALALNQWLGFWGLIILVSWQQIGYMMIIYIAGLQSIPGEVMEAAQIDGANSWQCLWKVTIPMMMPSITICTFLSITNGFKLFDPVSYTHLDVYKRQVCGYAADVSSRSNTGTGYNKIERSADSHAVNVK